MKKTAIILEGGGVRAIYSCGVLDVFLENGIEADAVVGVSAGALLGVNFLSKQAGRALRYNKKFNKDKNYMGLRPLLKEGNIVSTDYAYRRVPRQLDPFDNEEYKKSKAQMFAVVTNVNTGEPEYMRITDVFEQMDTLRASGSLPMFSKCVKIGEGEYLDGGVSDSVPFDWAIENGYDRIVVVLTRDIEYRKKPFSKFLGKLFLRKYPKILEKMLIRHENYNSQIEKLIALEKEGRVFVIRPSKAIEAKRLERDGEKIQNTYDLGVTDCKSSLVALKEYLEEGHNDWKKAWPI